MPSASDAAPGGETIVVPLPPRLTQHEARAALAPLLRALEGPPGAAGGRAYVVDGSALQQFDSTTLAVLLECRRDALQRGHRLRVQALPEGLWKLAGLYGVQGLLDPGPA